MAVIIEDVTCYFLQLPGELRNRIYRLVLTGGPSLIVFDNSGYDRPGLLSTCKQVRQEALSIYYYENNFFTVVVSYDAKALHNFTKMRETMGLDRRLFDVISSGTRPSDPHWINLLEWLRHYHTGDIEEHMVFPKRLRRKGCLDRRAYTLGVFFQVAKSFRPSSWQEVKVALNNLRPTLGLIDERWMK